VLPQTLENLDRADRREGIAADADVSLDDGVAQAHLDWIEVERDRELIE
jgi:hypothetical protein